MAAAPPPPPTPGAMQAYERVQRMLGHVDARSAPTVSLSPQGTASTTGVFGPSDLTVSFLQKLQATRGRGRPAGKDHVADSEAAVIQVDHAHAGLTFEHAAMRERLDRFYLAERAAVLNTIGTVDSFKHFHTIGLTMPETREICHQQVKDFVAHTPSFRFSDVVDEPLKWISHLEMLYMHGCSVATKAGVHFGLFGATVMGLGNAQHREFFAQKIHDLKVRGCFCLTELGHGSNAREIETTATWDQRTKEFVLVTPTDGAQKIFIGNLAQHANWAVVFAQLIVGTQHVGVHAFVVRIRDDASENVVENLRIVDCGPKNGLNGVDNGRCWFDGLRCPRNSLLDKFGSVNEAGTYVSPISSPLRRFTATIGQLVGGRVIVGQGAVHASKVGLTIAIKYAHTRPQFGPPGRPEQPIMNFLSHRRLLMPLLAKTYALQFAMNRLKVMYADLATAQGAEREELSKELHVLAAGLKPIATWHRSETLQTSRECCGGQGFLAANRIGVLRNDSDIDLTWEGQNVVLLQQVSGSLLKEFKEQYRADDNSTPSKFRGLLKYLENEAAFSWQTARANPRAQRHGAAGKRQLRDLDYYVRAFEFREGRLLRALINRLGAKPKESGPEGGANKRGAPKPSQFESWNQAGDLVLELARAHVDRQLIEAFVGEIDRLDSTTHPTPAEATLAPVLRALCALFAVSTINQHMGFYLTFRFFSPATSKTFWEAANTLCNQLAPVSLSLVDAFGIPDSVLGAPIAGDWQEQYAYPNVPGYVPVSQATKDAINHQTQRKAAASQ